MTITLGVKLVDGKLFVHHKRVFLAVPENVLLNSTSRIGHRDGVFIIVLCSESNNGHVVPLGTLKYMFMLSSS